MNIKKRLTLSIIVLAIFPMLVFAILSFVYFKNLIATEIGKNFGLLAAETLEKINKNILERKNNLIGWSSLNVMQEIFVDDVEGNILSNILKYIETYPEIYEILVLNDKRKIIATKNQNNYYKQYNAEYLETIIRDGNVWISDLYFDDFLNHAVIAIGAPVYLQASKNIIGAMIVFLPVEMIYSINDSIIINNNIQSEDCYSILLNKNFQIISAPEFIRKNGKFKLFEQYDKDDIIYILTHKKTDYFIKSGYLYGYSVEKITNSNFVSKNWILLNQISSKTAFKKVYIFMLFFFVMLLIFTIVIILLSKIFSEKFTNPIINFTELFKKGVNGDLTIKYKIDLKNECFKIKNCVEKDCYCYENSDVFCFLKKTREQSFENIEDYGCQNCEVYKKKYDDEIKRMAILFNEFILSIKYLIMQLQDMSETMALISTNTTNSMKLIIDGTIAQNNYNSKIKDTINLLTSSIEKTNQSVEETKNISNATNKISEEGENILDKTIMGLNAINNSVNKTFKIISNLNDSSKKIILISKIIEKISEQTNLLALNAAIEAARAGEYGRGFAVVADEVRKLAIQSSAKIEEINKVVNVITEQIKELNENFQVEIEDANNGVRLVKEFQNNFMDIRSSISLTIDSIKKMSELFKQVYNEMLGINLKIEEISKISSEQSEKAKKTGKEIIELVYLFNKVSESIKKFKTF